MTFSPTPKLRTVLWGWAGEPIVDADLARLDRLRRALEASDVRDRLLVLLPVADVDALLLRVARLIDRGVHPSPRRDWPSVPWPPL